MKAEAWGNRVASSAQGRGNKGKTKGKRGEFINKELLPRRTWNA